MNSRLLASVIILPFAILGAGSSVVGQTAKQSAAEGRAYAEALANPRSWNGKWFTPDGAEIYRDLPGFLVENGVIYQIVADGSRKKRAEIISLNKTYREGLGLVHEFSVTCIPQFGNPSAGTLKMESGFRGPYGGPTTAWVDAWPTIRGCNVFARREGPQFLLPYP